MEDKQIMYFKDWKNSKSGRIYAKIKELMSNAHRDKI